MLINVVHDLDLLRHLCGEVAEIQAMQSSHARGLEVEDTVSLNLRFESGAVGSFLASDAGVSPWGWDQATEETLAFPFLPDGVAYRFVGTRGALSVPNLAKYSYDPSVPADWHSPLSRTYLPVAPRGSFQAQLDHFVEVARGAGGTTRLGRGRIAHARARRGGGACRPHRQHGRRRTIPRRIDAGGLVTAARARGGSGDDDAALAATSTRSSSAADSRASRRRSASPRTD